MLEELGDQIDLKRVHLFGRMPHDQLQKLYRRSDLHVYLSKAFVLSWSLLEAMAVGAPLVCSDTGPVREILTDGVDSLLAPIDDSALLAQALQKCLEDCSSAKKRAMAAQRRALTSSTRT